MKNVIILKNPLLFFLCLLFAVSTCAKTIYVSVNGDGDYTAIQAAVDAADSNDVIIVKQGTYYEHIDLLGKSLTLRSTDPNDPDVVSGTIISGSNSGTCITIDSGENANTLIDGFYITDGNAHQGGGIYCDGTSPTIKNCILSRNSAYPESKRAGMGGGMYCFDGSPKIESCTFSKNSAYASREHASQGGGLCTTNSNLIVNCSTFIENSATNGGGGAVFVISYVLTEIPVFTGCLFRENSAVGGGAVWCPSSSKMIDCIFIGNTAYSNKMDNGLGGAVLNTGASEFKNCLFSGNSTDVVGGAIADLHSLNWPMIITNCTFTGNSAKGAGGVYGYDSYCKITNSVFYYNIAKSRNQIALCPASILDANYSDIEGGQSEIYSGIINWGPGNIDVDPCFVDPGFWDPSGTPTDANDDFWVVGDYHLLPQSACINAGDPNYIAGPNDTDFVGMPRVVGGRIDMGMFEYQRIVRTDVDVVYGGGCIVPGDTVTYNINYNYLNKPSLQEINSAYLIDYLPAQTEYISSSPAGYYDPCSHTITWPLGTLQPGDSGSVSLAAEVKPCSSACAKLENISEIKSGNTIYDNVTKQTGVCCPVFTIQSDLPEGECVGPGDIVTYSICYTAEGIGDDSVVIVSELSADVNYIWSPAGIYNPGSHTVFWYIGTLSSDGSDCVELLVRVNTNAEPLGTITNRCTIIGNCIDISTDEEIAVCCWPVNVIYVDRSANGNKDGTSWQDAYRQLPDALNNSDGCRKILVAEGLYRPDRGKNVQRADRTLSFVMENHLEIYGGFPSGGGSWQTRDPNTYKTVLSGDLDGDDPDIDPQDLLESDYRYDNSYHVITARNTDESAVLNGCTVSGGNACRQSPHDRGGGLDCYKATPTINNCTFTQNAAWRGGGIYSWGSTPRINKCTLYRNGAQKGGGIFNDSRSAPVFTQSTFIDNSTLTNGRGGGMYNAADFALTGYTFRGNSAGFGGGLYNTAELTVVDCELSENSAFNGGGLYNSQKSRPTVHACTFEKNSAENNGGGLYNDSCSSKITNCLLFSNDANNYGGGLFLNSGCHKISNCTFVENRTTYERHYGGAFYSSDSEAEITNNIFYYNKLWPGNEQAYIYYGEVFFAYNFLDGYGRDVRCYPWESLTWGSGNICGYRDDVDPCFVDPGYWDSNGTDHEHDDDFWVEGSDYHLLSDSPCVNAGDPNYITEPNETDLDGLPRIIGGRIDMGAYEFDSRPIAVAGPNQTVYAFIDRSADVNLDGSASYDNENDPIGYRWSWTIDDNVYEANGVSPTISLLVGQHEIELVVDDGLEESQPDYCTITVIEPLRTWLWLWPRSISCHARPKWLTTTMFLPRDIEPNDLNNQPLIMYPCDILSRYQRVFKMGRGRRARTVIIAAFDKSEICACLGLGWHRLEVAGRLQSGRYFYGTNMLIITRPRPRCWP